MGLKKVTMIPAMLLVGCAYCVRTSLARCSADAQCADGYYCESNSCRECLRCEDYARQPPPDPAACVKSLVQCGPCKDGLVEDVANDVSAACVPPQPGIGTTWVVALIVAAVVLFLLGCLLILYLLRKRGIFKMHINLGASVQRPEAPPASAPEELPPPYARYAGHAPHAPHDTHAPHAPHAPPAGLEDGLPKQPGSNTSGGLRPPSPDSRAASPFAEEAARQPFIQRSLLPRRGQATAGHQQARVFNRPAYIYPSPPPPPVYSDGSDNEGLDLHDDNTMESLWTPDAETPDHNGNPPAVVSSGATSSAGGANGLTAQLETARGTLLVRPPREPHPHHLPAKRKYPPHDSNNNGGGASGGEPSASGGSAAAAGAAIKVNLQATLQLSAGALAQHQPAPYTSHGPPHADPLPR